MAASFLSPLCGGREGRDPNQDLTIAAGRPVGSSPGVWPWVLLPSWLPFHLMQSWSCFLLCVWIASYLLSQILYACHLFWAFRMIIYFLEYPINKMQLVLRNLVKCIIQSSCAPHPNLGFREMVTIYFFTHTWWLIKCLTQPVAGKWRSNAWIMIHSCMTKLCWKLIISWKSHRMETERCK